MIQGRTLLCLSGDIFNAIFDFSIPAGDGVSLQVSGSMLQRKRDTESTWTDIFDLSVLTGAKGDPGDTGNGIESITLILGNHSPGTNRHLSNTND